MRLCDSLAVGSSDWPTSSVVPTQPHTMRIKLRSLEEHWAEWLALEHWQFRDLDL